MKHATLFIFSLVLLTGYSVLAQDIHFSQMRYSQFNVNPALAGAEQSLQAVANFREQWNSVAEPFTTIAAAVDLRIREQQSRNGFLALGVNFFNDVAGDVRMTTTSASLSLAYHLYVGDKSTIGSAIQVGYGQRGISSSESTWASQFMGDGFDRDMVSGESFQASSFFHFDVGGGIVYRFSKNDGYMLGNDHFDLSSGLAVYHANRPNNLFLVNGTDDLAMRFSGFAHANVGIGASNFSLLPALYYNRQGGHQEFLGGAYARILLREASKRTGFLEAFSMSYGLFYRLQDAFIAKFMLEYSNYSLGISYDFNASGLTAVSRGRGGMEFFIRFILPQPIGTGKKSRIN